MTMFRVKALGAALLMSSTRSVLRLHAARGLSPKEILFELNKLLVEDYALIALLCLYSLFPNTSRGQSERKQL
jgi:Stage II sporulation protein E (SpoIIE)